MKKKYDRLRHILYAFPQNNLQVPMQEKKYFISNTMMILNRWEESEPIQTVNT